MLHFFCIPCICMLHLLSICYILRMGLAPLDTVWGLRLTYMLLLLREGYTGYAYGKFVLYQLHLFHICYRHPTCRPEHHLIGVYYASTQEILLTPIDMFPEGGFTNKINEEYNKYVSGVLCLPARHPLISDAGNVSVSVPLMICAGFVYWHCAGRWAVLDNTHLKIVMHSVDHCCTATTEVWGLRRWQADHKSLVSAQWFVDSIIEETIPSIYIPIGLMSFM